VSIGAFGFGSSVIGFGLNAGYLGASEPRIGGFSLGASTGTVLAGCVRFYGGVARTGVGVATGCVPKPLDDSTSGYLAGVYDDDGLGVKAGRFEAPKFFGISDAGLAFGSSVIGFGLNAGNVKLVLSLKG
jgi:hypothetical protein